MQLLRRLFCSVILPGSLLLPCGHSIAADPALSPQPISRGVRSVTLPHFEPDMPVAAGRDEFMVVCVSCHSTRYVTMQPLFIQRQWEETVDKMVKVYGAQLDPQQRERIIGYLVTIHGPNSALQGAAARDDESEWTSPTQAPIGSETTPLLELAGKPDERANQVSRGADLFKQDCAACHGTTGRGDGWIGPVLLCKPKNLAATRFTMRLLSQVLWNGKRGTAMPSWRNLPQNDLAALGAYVQGLHAPDPGDLQASVDELHGKQIFLQNCAVCHGVSGDGKGTAAANLAPQPANFKLKQPNSDYLVQVLRDGIPGTAMPSWREQISEPDRQALAGYVRSLFEPAGPNEN